MHMLLAFSRNQSRTHFSKTRANARHPVRVVAVVLRERTARHSEWGTQVWTVGKKGTAAARQRNRGDLERRRIPAPRSVVQAQELWREHHGVAARGSTHKRRIRVSEEEGAQVASPRFSRRVTSRGTRRPRCHSASS